MDLSGWLLIYPFRHPLAADRMLGLLSHTLRNHDRATVHFEDAMIYMGTKKCEGRLLTLLTLVGIYS